MRTFRGRPVIVAGIDYTPKRGRHSKRPFNRDREAARAKRQREKLAEKRERQD